MIVQLVHAQLYLKRVRTWDTHAVHPLENPWRLALRREGKQGTRTNVKIRVGRAHNEDKDDRICDDNR